MLGQTVAFLFRGEYPGSAAQTSTSARALIAGTEGRTSYRDTSYRDTRRRRNALPRLLAGLVLAAGLAAACVPKTPTPPPTPTTVAIQPVAGGPVLLRDGLALRKLATTGAGSVKLALNPVDGLLYYLNPNTGVFKVGTGDSPTPQNVAGTFSLGAGYPAGFTVGPDGTLYVVTNQPVGDGTTQARVLRGTPNTGGGYDLVRRWPSPTPTR